MAKTNKYTSINFNHIYEKILPPNSTSPNSNPKLKTPSSSSSSSTSFSYSAISSAANKNHGGRMLVLTRPAPKPISIPQPQPQPQAPVQDPVLSEPCTDAISLSPLGTTGGGSPVFNQESEKEAPVIVAPPPKRDKFVPPHLRPGFVGREERPGPEVIRAREMGQRHFGSPGRYGEEGRPKSGGAHERMRGGGGHSDLAMMNRPRSSGNRPSPS